MRPFLRIAGGGRSTLSHNAIPRCSCDRRQFHIQSMLRIEQSAANVAESKAALHDTTNLGAADKKSSSKVKKERVDTQSVAPTKITTTSKIPKDILEKIKRPEKETPKYGFYVFFCQSKRRIRFYKAQLLIKVLYFCYNFL